MTPARIAVAVLTAALLLGSEAALALAPTETMRDWLAASDADRSRVLDQLRSGNARLRRADQSRVLACLNAAAEFPGHAELRIAEVAEACASPPAPDSEASQSEI